MFGKLIPKVSLLRSLRNITTIRFAFAQYSSQEPATEGQQLNADRMATFYRNAIRRININDKGRGKFTQHHLIKLTKLTENQNQLPLLFEGYYNFLGHFTVISNKTVDKMLVKAMSFQETPIQSILEIFANHNYLSYFPGYHITKQLLNIVSKEQEHLSKFINILIVSPLIKINQDIIQDMLQILKKETLMKGNFSSITKLLVQRSFLGLIDESMNATDLLHHLSEALKRRLSIEHHPIMTSSTYIIQFLKKIQENSQESQEISEKVAIVAHAFGIRGLFSEHLLKLKQLSNVQNFVRYLQHCSQSYRTSVLNNLQSQSASEDILQLFKPLSKGNEEVQAEEGKEE